MAQRQRFHHNNRRVGGPLAPANRSGLQTPPETVERRAPVVYGKPFVLFEDEAKNTFIFKAGEWIPYGSSIAECRLTCQVKKLAQAVNNRIRYEVRCPVE
jgi:hypothetical protein